MPACKASTRFGHLLGSAAQNFAQNVQIHALRKADKVQCSFHLAAHGIDIAQGVGRCDLAEGIGVIHHRREKIHCLYQRYIIGNAVYSRIIPAVVPDQKARVSCPARQLFQNTAPAPSFAVHPPPVQNTILPSLLMHVLLSRNET